MKNKTIQELEEIYDLELDKIISEIRNKKPKLVLLQFPDGLKSYAIAVVDYLKEKTNTEFLIWLGDCFGACDTPVNLGKISSKIDLIIQFGHNKIYPKF